MPYYLLLFEITLNVAMVVLGTLLMVRARDNAMRFWWGAIVAVSGAILFRDNSIWIAHYNPDFYAVHRKLLGFKSMLTWFIPAAAVSLFPLVSLRPGYLTKLRTTVLSIPILMTAVIVLCYYRFNGRITPLYSVGEIVGRIDQLDVRLRLMVFVVTLIIPLAYFFAPFLIAFSSSRRQTTPTMKVYIASILFIALYYVAFTLFVNDFVFYTYGIVMALFLLAYSVLFLLYENPFSSRKDPANESTPDRKVPAERLYADMAAYLAAESSFIRPGYAIGELAEALGVTPSLAAEAIKSGGFTGFREYMNYLRVQRFKQLAREPSGKHVKELMYDSGFSSRSVFYRTFSGYENITPTKYIERLSRP